MSDLLENLNAEQAAAVTHKNGPLMIVAGAGTGKTTVITRRIAWLIEQGFAKPENILSLTFTEKAAAEMEERVDMLLPYGYVDIQISTFHAFCETLLRQYAAEIGLSRDFRMVTDLDAWLLCRRELERFELDYYRPLGNPTRYLRGLLTHFSRAKDVAVNPEGYLAFAQGKVADLDRTHADEEATSEVQRIKELAGAYHTYQQILLENDALDFGDLLLYTLKLLQERPKVLAQLRRRFTYVLVDEFQDTNYAQYELIKLLAAPANNLTVVGDDDQSIYKFRGASLANILQFERDYETAARVVLTKNYRSVQQILDHAHSFIQKNNPNRLEARANGCLSKQLESQRSDEGAIGHIHAETLEEECEAVLAKMKALKEQHPDATWNDFAILTRSNDAAGPFLSTLDRAHIPYQFLALRGLYVKPVILDLLAYLHAIDRPHDSPSLYRVLSHPRLGIPPLAVAELTQYANRKGKSLFEACQTVSVLSSVDADAAEKVAKLLVDLAGVRAKATNRPVSELFIMAARDGGFVDYLNKRSEREKTESFRYLQQFYERLKRFCEGHDNPVLRHFLDEYAHERDAGEEGAMTADLDAGPDLVRIMTVHASKGLEFRFVFVVNLIDQRFPTVARGDAIPLPEGLSKEEVLEGDWHLEEERRLFYVAMTRAKEHLYFSSADDYGGTRKRKISRFLVELGFEKPSGKVREKKDPFLDLPEEKEQSTDKQRLVAPIIHLPKQFSFTQLSAFRTCPLQYKFAHVLKIPVFGKWTFSYGKTMHNTLQHFFNDWIERSGNVQVSLFDTKAQQEASAIPVTLNELLQHYQNAWQDDWYPDDATREKYREQGKKQLRAFYAQLEITTHDPAYIEQDFTLKFGGVTIKGRIDRIDRVEGGVEIIDYKTGGAKTLETMDKSDKEQLMLYQMAARDILGLKPVRLTYYYLENQSRVSFIATDDELLDLQGRIMERVAGIRDSKFVATPGFHCTFCDFADICEYRQR
jgi:DNA helicase-2/ATP-dependent DNA helicase PcrA